jgi:hypothetical protein
MKTAVVLAVVSNAAAVVVVMYVYSILVYIELHVGSTIV